MWKNDEKVIQERDSKNTDYKSILGLKGQVELFDVQDAYRKKLMNMTQIKSKMGAELRKIASQKTEEINEAYDFLKKEYTPKDVKKEEIDKLIQDGINFVQAAEQNQDMKSGKRPRLV